MVVGVKYREKGVVRRFGACDGYDQFVSDMARGYFDAEVMEKEKLIKEFSEEYQKMNDKDSFKGQYLESLIYVLNKEIKTIQKYS